MGKKNDKMTQNSVISAELLLSKLTVIEGVTSKKMFGGHGIFHEKKMFGIISAKGAYFLKANDLTKGDYLAKGSEKHSRMPYYAIPTDVLEDLDLLLAWAKKSIEISK